MATTHFSKRFHEEIKPFPEMIRQGNLALLTQSYPSQEKQEIAEIRGLARVSVTEGFNPLMPHREVLISI